MPPDADHCDPWAGRERADRVGRRFLHSAHVFASTVREVLQDELLRAVGDVQLTSSQLYLLRLMAWDHQRQVGKVADLLGISPAAASRRTDKLERLGLLVREAVPGDRRAKLLSVSHEGRELIRRYEAEETRLAAATVDSMPTDAVEALTELLVRVALALLQAAPSKRSCCLRCAAHLEKDCLVGGVLGGCPHHTEFGRGQMR